MTTCNVAALRGSASSCQTHSRSLSTDTTLFASSTSAARTICCFVPPRLRDRPSHVQSNGPSAANHSGFGSLLAALVTTESYAALVGRSQRGRPQLYLRSRAAESQRGDQRDIAVCQLVAGPLIQILPARCVESSCDPFVVSDQPAEGSVRGVVGTGSDGVDETVRVGTGRSTAPDRVHPSRPVDALEDDPIGCRSGQLVQPRTRPHAQATAGAITRHAAHPRTRPHPQATPGAITP